MTTNQVPHITISGMVASSDAARPRNMADICACWDKTNMQRARKLLRGREPIKAQDATAWAALTALALDMMLHGRDVVATITKEYEAVAC